MPPDMKVIVLVDICFFLGIWFGWLLWGCRDPEAHDEAKKEDVR